MASKVILRSLMSLCNIERRVQWQRMASSLLTQLNNSQKSLLANTAFVKMFMTSFKFYEAIQMYLEKVCQWTFASDEILHRNVRLHYIL